MPLTFNPCEPFGNIMRYAERLCPGLRVQLAFGTWDDFGLTEPPEQGHEPQFAVMEMDDDSYQVLLNLTLPIYEGINLFATGVAACIAAARGEPDTQEMVEAHTTAIMLLMQAEGDLWDIQHAPEAEARARELHPEVSFSEKKTPRMLG